MSGIAVTEIRGKVGGSVFSRNSGGAFVRNRVDPAFPATSYQVAQNAIFAQVSQAWRDLTDLQRTGFIQAAESGEWNWTNSLGVEVQPTGAQLFCQINLRLYDYGFPITEVPEKVSLTPLNVDTITTLVDGGGWEHFEIASNDSVVPADTEVQVWCTYQLSAGVSRPRSSAFKLIYTGSESTAWDGLDLIGYSNARFPVPVVGSKIGLKFILRSTLSSQSLMFYKAMQEIGPA